MTNDVPISEREREILALVATGATNQQIALQLNISANTVKVHLRNIFGKIGVVSRTEATVYAMRNGLVPMHDLDAATLVAVLPDPAEAPATEAFLPADPLPPPAAAPVPEAAASVPEAAAPVHASGPSGLAAAPVSPSAELVAMPPLATPSSPNWRPWLVFLAVFSVVALAVIALLLLDQNTPTAPQIGLPPDNEATVTSSVSSRWTPRAPMPAPRDHFALAAFDLQRELYVFGGADADGVSPRIDRYDPANDLWTSLGEKPVPVQHASAVTLRGQIYLPGGEDAEGRVRDLLEIYDPRERSWSTGPPLPAPRSRYTLVAWDGQIYLIGGWDGQAARAEVFIFDPDANRWADGPTLPTARQQAGAVIANGRLYLIGGTGTAGPLRDSVRLDPGDDASRRWISLAPLPQPIAAPAVVAPAGTLLVFNPELQEGLQYNQVSDVWQPFPVPAEATLASSVVLLETSIYFVAAASAPHPGAVGQYQMIYTIFLP